MDEENQSSGSVIILFNQLIRCLVAKANHKPPHLEADQVDRDAQHQHLKRKLYEILYRKLNGPLSNKFTLDDEQDTQEERSKEKLLQVAFQLRQKRKFDQGHRLEKLIAALPDLENGKFLYKVCP